MWPFQKKSNKDKVKDGLTQAGRGVGGMVGEAAERTGITPTKMSLVDRITHRFNSVMAYIDTFAAEVFKLGSSFNDAREAAQESFNVMNKAALGNQAQVFKGQVLTPRSTKLEDLRKAKREAMQEARREGRETRREGFRKKHTQPAASVTAHPPKAGNHPERGPRYWRKRNPRKANSPELGTPEGRGKR